jgi:hypothetical protein
VRRALPWAAAAIVVLAPAAAAGPQRTAMEPVTRFLAKEKVVAGFYKGRTIRYIDLGPVKLAPGNKVAPIWAVTNGTRGQHNIVDVAPGDQGYTPLWAVVQVTFRPGVAPTTLRSAAQVRAAARAGRVTLKKTPIVVNCPVLGFGQRQTLGFYRTKLVQYFDFGAIKLARGNKVAPIWAVTNGTSDQHNVIDVAPGDRGYTPLWQVSMVTWKDGTTPRTLTSATAVRRALAAGEATVKRTSTVVNCPVT